MTTETDHPTDRCRICDGRDLAPVLDLGRQPLANALLAPDSAPGAEPRYPLALCRCAGCGLVQLTHDVPASVLFPADYPFATGQSRAMGAHFAALAEECVARFVPEDGLLLEIGSNDGTLLASVKDAGVRRLGVDPAANLARVAMERHGVETRVGFFGARAAREIRAAYGPAHCVVACNVVAHCEDLHDLLAGVVEVLADDGVFVFEFPWVRDMVAGVSFDAVYHEHRSYLGIVPVNALLARHGMEPFGARRVPTHGGSLRVYARRDRGAALESLVARVSVIEATDVTPATLARFAACAAATRERLPRAVAEAWRDGRRVAGYGAPAKATVLLNYCGLTHRDVPFACDSTPAKQGRLIPGARVAVVAPEMFRSARPDVGLLFAWNHYDEIRAKEAAWLAGGGRFILPFEPPG